MFKKILIANRGEIAVRIQRTCREMGISTLALYQPADREALHVRLADECVLLESTQGFVDQGEILRIASEHGADAIHPGYGFLAEREDFIQACQEGGITFIGPPLGVLQNIRHKIQVQQRAEQVGFSTPPHSGRTFGLGSLSADMPALQEEAERLGFPLVIKSARGGRGRGERLVWSAERLERAVRRAQAEALVVYGERHVYLEKAIVPAHQIGVQVIGDHFGNLIHLGEREGSLLYGNQKLIEEAPAPCLTSAQRQQLWQAALDLARLFDCRCLATLEFLVDQDGQFYFTEFKPRIQIEHPLTEMLSRVDLVREQIRIAAGEALSLRQEDVRLDGWAMQCRIRAQDPWQQFLPSPGRLRQARFPSGPELRLDTYLYPGCDVPAEYDPLVAKLGAWAPDRLACLARLRAALQECQLTGIATNLPLIQRILEQPDFMHGEYSTDFSLIEAAQDVEVDALRYRDLAAIAAIDYLRRNQMYNPTMPERLSGGWHRSSRRLPE